MIFCHNCGTKQPETTRFCTSCGTQLARLRNAAEEPGDALGGAAEQPRQTTSWTGQPGPSQSQPPAAPAAAPAMPLGSSVQAGAWHAGASPDPTSAGTQGVAGSAAMPSMGQLWHRYGGDWSRALISILLLTISLSLPWSSQGSSADNVPALLAIIVALPIGVVDLLLRPAVVGRVFSAEQRLMFRALLAAPLVAVALWALIDNLVHGSGFGTGIGVALTGAAVGLTGVVTMSEPSQARTWLTAAAGSLVVSLAWLGWAAVQTFKVAAAMGGEGGAGYWFSVFAAVVMLGWMVWLAGWLAQMAFAGSPRTAPIACWLAACLGVWLVLARLFTMAFKVDTSGPVIDGAIAFFAVGVALLTAPSIRMALPQPPATNWISAAYTGLFILGTAHIVSFLTIALLLSQLQSAQSGYVWLLVLQMAGAAGAFVTRSGLGRDSRTGRIPVLVYAACFTAAFWLTYLIADSITVSSYAVNEAVLMVGPAAVAFCLLVPSSVRKMLGPIGVPAAFQGLQAPQGTPGAPTVPGYAPGQVPDSQFPGGPPASPGVSPDGQR